MEQGIIVYKDDHIVIRTIKKGDEFKMLDYINELSQEKTFIMFQGNIMNIEEEKKYLDHQLDLMKNKKAIQLLVFQNDTIIGISGIEMRDKVQSHIGALGISLLKPFRGKGFGKILLKTLLHEAQCYLPGLRIVTLSVFANNSLAISFYKKFGFVQYGSLPQRILHKGEYVDHHDMFKVIA